MKVLIVKLSSLGDVVHAMPAVQDMRRALPGAQIDWVVEKGFAPLVRRCEGVSRVIECELRRWIKEPLSAQTRAQWRAFRADLHVQAYDAVIDLQGLAKSALMSRMARLSAGGKRYALANRTDGSSYEVPTRWVADIAIEVPAHIHAVQRSRELCGRSLGYPLPAALQFGLNAHAAGTGREIAFVHGSSRDDKCWPQTHWVSLGRQLMAAGYTLGLPHGSAAERERSEHIAHELDGSTQVWPRMELGALADRMAACAGVIGVDSGLSHVAVALDVPHVQLYNFDTAWRTGPYGARQVSVYAQPTPAVDMVWQAWEQVRTAT